jgi:hypothetical protein
MEFLTRLRGKNGAAAGAVTALDQFFSPGAARAREEADRQHELVLPAPSPGDRLLEAGIVVFDVPPAPPPSVECAVDGQF